MPKDLVDHCRCGHSPTLHASGRYACILRYSWPYLSDCSLRVARSCPCRRYRPARWLDDHRLWRHIAVRAWWLTPERVAYWVINHWPAGRCWCDLYGSVEPIRDPRIRAEYSGRYACLCDAPLPTDAGVPDGHCYCPPVRGDLS